MIDDPQPIIETEDDEKNYGGALKVMGRPRKNLEEIGCSGF